jgi:hypothetical protein
MSHGPISFRPIYRDPYDGIQTEIPDGGLVNIGGTTSPTFTVGGKAVMLADGSTSNGDPSAVANLQISYQNTRDSDGHASINLRAGHDFFVKSVDASKYLKIDSETGDVSITGNLYVSGSTTVVETMVTDYDHLTLSPSLSGTTAFRIQYDAGIVPNQSYIEVYDNRLARNVFAIDKFGTTEIYSIRLESDLNLVEGALVDGVDVSAFWDEYSQHISHTPNGVKHWTDEILLSASVHGVPAESKLQNLLENFDSSINISNQLVSQIQSRVDELRSDVDNIEFEQALEPRGFIYVQQEAATEWVIAHNKGTSNFTYVLFDGDGRQFIPDEVIVDSPDTLRIRMNVASTGKVNIIFFVPQPM